MGRPVILSQIIVFRAFEAQHVIYTSLCQAMFSKQLNGLWSRAFIIYEDAVVSMRGKMTKNTKWGLTKWKLKAIGRVRDTRRCSEEQHLRSAWNEDLRSLLSFVAVHHQMNRIYFFHESADYQDLNSEMICKEDSGGSWKIPHLSQNTHICKCWGPCSVCGKRA